MTSLEIWLIIATLLLSITTSVVMWYLRKLLSRFFIISQNLNDLADMVQNYQEHLKQIYAMEAYYGDETINHLIQHTRSLVEMLEDYKDVYDIIEPLQTVEETLIYDNREAEEEEEEIPIPLTEENVFYAGTRRRDS